MQYLRRLLQAPPSEQSKEDPTGASAPSPDDPQTKLEKREIAATLEGIGGEIERLEGIVSDFVNFAQPTDIDPRPCDLAVVTRSVLDVFAEELAVNQVRVEIDLPHVLPVHADEKRIRQVLTNLVKNAREAVACEGCPEMGRLLRVEGRTENGRVALTVSDTGPGLPPDQADRIFEPYFSTKRGGLGLGLALSRRIAEAHGGSLTAQNGSSGCGARFTLTIPAAEEVAGGQ